jgi:hypothetical protein
MAVAMQFTDLNNDGIPRNISRSAIKPRVLVMRVQFKTFESQFLTRQKMLQKAAEFATQMGPERLINVTHSEDHHESFITVWYWEGERVNEGIPAAGAPPACISDPSRDTTPDAPQTRAKLSDSSRTGNGKEPESAVYTR